MFVLWFSLHRVKLLGCDQRVRKPSQVKVTEIRPVTTAKIFTQEAMNHGKLNGSHFYISMYVSNQTSRSTMSDYVTILHCSNQQQRVKETRK
jgi:hypothetical protein